MNAIMDMTQSYIERINKVVDFIELNLEERIDLDMLAQVACLSKFHFHRIFQSFTHETLYQFINRLRIERAATLLLTRKNTITHIAFSCGFNDSATFSRAFKKHFSISASQWRKKKNSKIRQDFTRRPLYFCMNTPLGDGQSEKAVAIEERQLDQMAILYIRHTGPFAGNSQLFLSLFQELLAWAKPRGLVNYPATKSIVIYHDPVGITEKEKLRISVGISAPGDVLAQGKIGKLWVSKGRYLICRFELKNDAYGQAWAHVYRNVIPQRGLQPNDGYCFETYPHNCYNKMTDTTMVDICVPVKAF
jgi:AraC family transcriptional regulator